VKKLQDNNFDILSLISSDKGCLSGDTRIKTSDGHICLKDIKSKTINIKSYNFITKEATDATAIFYESGEKELYEITTISGKNIKATKDHVFFVKREDDILQLRLEQIKKGDLLLCQED
jgi:intein/homing endonuclease